MQTLTLDYIVSYICDDDIIDCKNINIDKDIFPLKHNTTLNSIDFIKFKDIFNNHVDRYGIIQKNAKQENISFYYSLLFILDDDFITLSDNDKIIFIKILKTKLKNDILNNSLISKYNLLKVGRSKKILIEELKNNNINKYIIHILLFYFDINIIIFNFDNDNIYFYYNEDEFNKYKINIFIANSDDYYEPIIYKNNVSKYFKYNSNILDYIICNYYIKLKNIHYKKHIAKKFIINLNMELYIENIQIDNNIIDLSNQFDIKSNDIENNLSDDSLDYNINTDDSDDSKDYKSEYEEDTTNNEENINKKSNDSHPDYNSWTKSKLLKYKRDELINICKLYTNDLDFDKKNKESLVNIIKS